MECVYKEHRHVFDTLGNGTAALRARGPVVRPRDTARYILVCNTRAADQKYVRSSKRRNRRRVDEVATLLARVEPRLQRGGASTEHERSGGGEGKGGLHVDGKEGCAWNERVGVLKWKERAGNQCWRAKESGRARWASGDAGWRARRRAKRASYTILPASLLSAAA
jgi:hypothetical protein